MHRRQMCALNPNSRQTSTLTLGIIKVKYSLLTKNSHLNEPPQSSIDGGHSGLKTDGSSLENWDGILICTAAAYQNMNWLEEWWDWGKKKKKLDWSLFNFFLLRFSKLCTGKYKVSGPQWWFIRITVIMQ